MNIQKLRGILEDNTVNYFLPIGKTEVPLNAYLGKTITLEFEGEIHCIACQRVTKKSYNQGYCYPCSQTLARCDLCIVKPELCHYAKGTCREPEWGETHCLIPHVIYLANTSGLKVGITRETQIPTRWIDQGATQALPIVKVKTRHQAGLVEVMLKTYFNDKTDWRKMLQGSADKIDLEMEREKLLKNIDLSSHEVCNFKALEIHYPVLEYPKKIQSLNFEKTPKITGTLLGIKGQYLILDIGVLNIRNQIGYKLSII